MNSCFREECNMMDRSLSALCFFVSIEPDKQEIIITVQYEK